MASLTACPSADLPVVVPGGGLLPGLLHPHVLPPSPRPGQPALFCEEPGQVPRHPRPARPRHQLCEYLVLAPQMLDDLQCLPQTESGPPSCHISLNKILVWQPQVM